MKNVLIIVNDVDGDEFQIYNLTPDDYTEKDLEELRRLHNNVQCNLKDWFEEFIDIYTPVFDQWDHSKPAPQLNVENVEIIYIVKT